MSDAHSKLLGVCGRVYIALVNDLDFISNSDTEALIDDFEKAIYEVTGLKPGRCMWCLQRCDGVSSGLVSRDGCSLCPACAEDAKKISL